MSDYIKSTNFASKDSLSAGNPLKIVKGTEIDTEFNNIATAVATKADLNSPTFIGTPVAPTPALSAAGTTVATVAAIQALYPVGSIYINAGVTTNPATLLGFGTWTSFGAGKVLVGQDAGDALFDTLEETGGSKDAIVPSHTHTGSTAAGGSATGTVNGGNPGDFGNFASGTGVLSATGAAQPNRPQGSAGSNGNLPTLTLTIPTHTHAVTVNAAGVSATNANLQPYITVAMWKRTA